jgi:hypothetical protein
MINRSGGVADISNKPVAQRATATAVPALCAIAQALLFFGVQEHA